ncbi:hypothetical protein ACIQV3_09555 [Streptomyces sp. NPDC099050]|uniref:hypothetical protein n=1 Tax=Streptomyces sp. NPDC099050 TaxID=3366100 RepID=UPI0037F42603
MKDPFACDDPPVLSPFAPADRVAARRTVAAHAHSPAELEMLLDMLGLVPDEKPVRTTTSGPERLGG